jgi:hypothetical protein
MDGSEAIEQISYETHDCTIMRHGYMAWVARYIRGESLKVQTGR